MTTFFLLCFDLISVCGLSFYSLCFRLVERRQALVMKKAEQTNRVVSSLFPKSVHDRLMNTNEDEKSKRGLIAPNRRLKGYLNGDEDEEYGGDPIADLFPYCTVLFAGM